MEEQSNLEINPKITDQTKEIVTDETVTPLHDVGNGYVEFNKGLYKIEALKEIKPELFVVQADNITNQLSSSFGSKFPRIAKKGDIFVRVDVLPNRVFKFDGSKWLEQNKNVSQTYLNNKEYLKFLVNKIDTGEYDLDNLNDIEKFELENHLKGNQSN